MAHRVLRAGPAARGRPSEDDAAPAEPRPAASRGRGRGDGSKVGVDSDVRELRPHALDAGSGNLLAVVELQALQAAAVLQVLQGHVGDEQAVVQLQHPQPLVATGAVA